MSGLQMNSITAAGNAAAAKVASALLPRKQSTQLVPMGSVQSGKPALKAQASAANTPTTTAGGTQNITSSDFLTLLVSELKNQDPTQPADPNAYITQLAQVNSLQQLIQINSGVSTLDGAVSTPTSTAKNKMIIGE